MPRVTVRRSPRSRSIRIAVHVDGAVIVTAAHIFSERQIASFIAKHSVWIQEKVQKALRRTVLRISKHEVTILKIRAQEIAENRLKHFNAHYQYHYKTVRIGGQKSRWGSCSRSGAICFNYKIAVLPTHLIDYIVVHELCHLGEMNHSKRFWSLVAQTIPEHAVFRKELRNIVVMLAP